MNWYLKRVTQAVFTFLVVINLSFMMIHFLPGGPIDYLIANLQAPGSSSTMSPSEIQQLAQTYINVDPQQPLSEQWLDYMTAVLQGDFGRSIWFNKPVAELIAASMPWTVFIMTLSLVGTFAIGVPLGALMAYNEGSRFDVGMTFYSVVSTSIPYYVTAVLFILFVSYQFDLLPEGGTYSSGTTPGVNAPYILGILEHAILPSLSVILTGFGGWALSMRGNSIRVIGEDYLRVARLRGLDPGRTAIRYVGHNAILPMYTGFLISIGALFGGSVILETIFNYQGAGYYLFQAISARDFPLLMGMFFIITSAVIVGILVADLTYGLVDPRISQSDEEGMEAY
jgi:peptide/nickel transport system permease protein